MTGSSASKTRGDAPMLLVRMGKRLMLD